MIIAEVLAKLEGVKKNGNGWSALCPAHDDSNPSLSISEGRDGRVLLTCHRGCDRQAIVEALGLKGGDLFDEPMRGNSAARLQTVAEYHYHDENDAHLFDVVRLHPKSFLQRAASGAWSMKGVRRVPYRLPQLLKAVQMGRTIFVVEGEKDACALVKHGFAATTNPGGAGKWHPEYDAYFAGALVALLPDNDEVGRAHMEQVARRLVSVAKDVRIIRLPDVPAKGDVTDWFAAGGTADALKGLVRATTALSVETGPPAPDATVPVVPVLDSPAPVKDVRRGRYDVLANALKIPAAGDAEDEAALASIAGIPTMRAAAFVGPIGAYVRGLRGYTEASPAVVLGAILAGFGAMVGRGPHHRIGSARHGTNLFVVAFGNTSSGRKSTAMGDGRLLLEEVDLAFWRGSTTRVLGGFGSGEGIVARLAPPVGKDGVSSPVAEDPRLLIEESELGALLTIKRRDGNTIGHNLRQLWDGNTVHNNTKSARVSVTEHHVALLGAITGEELRLLLSSQDASSGFANRLLFLYSARADVLPNAPPVPRSIIVRTAEALRHALGVAQVERRIELTADAADWWSSYYYADAARVGTGDSIQAKLNARHLPILRRLALVYCVADARDAVTVEDLEAGRAIVDYSEASVGIAFADADALPPDARKLLDALTVAGPAGLARGRWAEDVFRSKGTRVERLHDAARALQSRGLAFPMREPSDGGRPRETWRLARFAAAAGWSLTGDRDLRDLGEKQGVSAGRCSDLPPVNPLNPLNPYPPHVDTVPVIHHPPRAEKPQAELAV